MSGAAVCMGNKSLCCAQERLLLGEQELDGLAELMAGLDTPGP